MKPPRWLLGGCLLFWGWRTGFWEIAAVMAAAVEGAGFLRRRWEFSLSDFNRVSDACTTLFIGMVLWLLATRPPTQVVFIALQWLPMAYFPIIMAQKLSAGAGVDLRALSLIFRKGKKSQDRAVVLDLTYPYGILCVLSAGAANFRSPGYFPGVLLLAGLGLSPSRSRRFSPVLWGMILLLAGALGWAGQAGLHRLQGIIEEKGLEWFASLNGDADPFRTVTAIGDVGELKPSDRIRFRVRGPDPGGESLLLRETSYNSYRHSRWYAVKAQFETVRKAGGGEWPLAAARSPARTVTVITPLSGGEGLLPLPLGTFRISGLPADEVAVNPYGAVRAAGAPGLVDYTARHHPAAGFARPPDANDLVIPGNLAEILYRIVSAEGIGGEVDRRDKGTGGRRDKGTEGRRDKGTEGQRDKGGASDAAVRGVARFFGQGFSYSLDPALRGSGSMPLADFLVRSRAGHCEYFATAATLLLRAAGVPARYAVGYSVQEYSRLEKAFVVRDRHAHAWALAWVGGAWRAVDVTPPDWSRIEREAAGWTLMSDLWAWLRYRISWLRYREEARKHLVWLLIPLALVLARRFYRERGGVRRVRTAEAVRRGPEIRPGADSDFYRIESYLSERGYGRETGEPLSHWLRRLARQEPGDIEPLFPLLALHYRTRFGRKPLDRAERAALTAGVEDWIQARREREAAVRERDREGAARPGR